MTALLFTGCALIAWAAPAIFFLVLVAPRPQLVVTFLIATFFGLLAFGLGSVLWLIIPGARENTLPQAFFLAIAMGLLRLGFSLAMHNGGRNFMAVGTNSIGLPMIPFHQAIAGGLGFGISVSLVLYGEFIIDSYGHAAVFLPTSCNDRTTFIDAAVMSLCVTVYCVGAQIVATEAFTPSSPPLKFFLGLGGLFVGEMMLLFSPAISYSTNLCLGPLLLPPVFALTAPAAAAAIALQGDYSSRKEVSRERAAAAREAAAVAREAEAAAAAAAAGGAGAGGVGAG